MRELQLAPSILSADFASLGDAVHSVEEQASWIHADIMDGHFVPTLTMGPLTIKALAAVTEVPIECHLMVTNPRDLIEQFALSGAARCTVHVEVGCVVEMIEKARYLGIGVGVALSPETPVSEVLPYLELVDVILVMTVHPGFGGQRFISEVVPKISEISEYIRNNSLDADIEVDGGIGPATAAQVVDAGANVLVAGSALFSAGTSPADASKKLLQVAGEASLS